MKLLTLENYKNIKFIIKNFDLIYVLIWVCRRKKELYVVVKFERAYMHFSKSLLRKTHLLFKHA